MAYRVSIDKAAHNMLQCDDVRAQRRRVSKEDKRFIELNEANFHPSEIHLTLNVKGSDHKRHFSQCCSVEKAEKS